MLNKKKTVLLHEDTYEQQLKWIEFGIQMGWCGPAVCHTHDGVPTTEAEDEEFEEGFDPCIFVVRVYESQEQRKQVEENHSATQWRK